MGVLASGIARAANIENPDWDDRLCIVSEFSPDEPWSPQRAMQRNGTIASLSDRVVVIAASKSGGSWEMAQLCLKKKKPLYVLDLPPEVAAGNRSLIKSGARPFSTDEVEICLNFDESLGPDQPSLF